MWPNTASFGPARRGPYRLDASVPQTTLVWDQDIQAVADPEPETVWQAPYRRYAAHPYADGHEGFVMRGTATLGDRLPGRLHAGQVALDGGYDVGRRSRAGLQLRFAFWRFGFESSVTTHFHGRAHAEGPFGVRVIGSGHALAAPVLRPRLNVWLGAGLTYATEPRDPDSIRVEFATGPSLTSMVDVFIARPVVLSGRADMGMLAGSLMLAGRGTLGFMLHGFEFHAGYEARRYGDVLLQGPLLGVRAWF